MREVQHLSSRTKPTHACNRHRAAQPSKRPQRERAPQAQEDQHQHRAPKPGAATPYKSLVRSDSMLPRCSKSSTETPGPNRAVPLTEAASPSRPKLRTDSELPDTRSPTPTLRTSTRTAPDHAQKPSCPHEQTHAAATRSQGAGSPAPTSSSRAKRSYAATACFPS